MASSSTGGHMMMPSSSGGGDQMYDVFLSFRGEDTRRTFVCHLYEALQRSMINAYIDSEDLDKGKRISELLIAIEDSRISIVVLSQDYASSKWCLRELAKIMECLDKKQQIVMPIFYDVDPSNVRKIKGTFAQAFAKHEADSDLVKEELESWRSALTRFADLSGWDSRDYNTRKVLVVLDDVKNFSQIKELLGEPHALGKGSRIIVTTRDKQSPKEVDETYHPDCLNQDKSRELLVKHAFRTDPPSEEYIDLLNQAIEYAQGLPLALKVLGASLYDKKIHQWKDLLVKIKTIPDRKIMDVLRISFKGLDVLEQQIFLDIACLFRGWDHLEVTEILHDFHSRIGLENLVNRALVTISKSGNLDMHDLLQEMGREIARREYLGGPVKEPGKRTRLWSFKDVNQVLTQNTATDAIEWLMLDLKKEGAYCINVGAFVRMTKLRVLIIRGWWFLPKKKTSREGGVGVSLQELQYLTLKRCRQLKILPSSLHMKSLVTFKLFGCSNLEKFPEISDVMSKLQKLDLSETAIKELHESINNLTGLRVLNLSDCKELTTLPSSIHLSSLQELDLNGCSNLENFPEISGIMKELPELYLDGTAVRGLPSSIDTLKGIKKLSMRNCKSLECLPDSICNLAQLTHLDLEGCNRLKSIPELSSINRLNAHCCTALETVSTPKIDCTYLDFRFSNCRRLVARENLGAKK